MKAAKDFDVSVTYLFLGNGTKVGPSCAATSTAAEGGFKKITGLSGTASPSSFACSR